MIMSIYRMPTGHWDLRRVIYLFAGIFTVSSIAGAIGFDDLRWLALAGLVGVMQIIFAVTGYCPMAILLDRLGVPRD